MAAPDNGHESGFAISFKTDLAKISLERPVAVSLSCRIHLLCQDIVVPVSTVSAFLHLWFNKPHSAVGPQQAA